MLDDAKLTPMFEQYKNIKADYQDALLFYRMGDFYELFFEDAITASRELQITLTSRCKGANAVPMAGVPWHSADTYISQLIAKGYVIAICEQTDDAKPGKGLMERSVTRIITPGTIVDDINLESNHNNYLGCILQNEEQNLFTFVWAEISTSKWTGAEFNKLDEVWQWVKKMQPRELLLPKDLNLPERSLLPYMHVVHIQNIPNIPRAQEILCQAQHVPTVTVLGLDKKPLLTQTCAALLTYVEQTQKTPIDQMAPFSPLNLSRHMIIDEVTERHLEIFSCLNGQKGKGTLRAVVDKTVTGMGGRLLEQMLHHPLKEEESILYIQSCVAFFFANDTLRSSLRKLLSNIADMERITQRIGLNRCSPKDFIQLRSSLTHLPKLKTLLAKANALNPTQGISQILDNFDSLEECSQHLHRALVDDPPQLITDGGLFLSGFNAELDSLLDIIEHAETKLQDLLEQERERSNMPKLKMGYNRVFGYYYEISKSQKYTIPDYFVRRQSLANCERFVTQELKTLEEALVSASDKRKTLEYSLFQELRNYVNTLHERLLKTAKLIGNLDYWQALAETGRVNSWCVPTFSKHNELSITQGRHPVIEHMLGKSNFVPNDLQLRQGHNFCLLTGPNMAGKSTILRQTALICLLAQIGSMVPATTAHIGLIDRLFSRVGAQDNLAQGESTFMVEMIETARILRQSTKQSLLILDEIGRGTSTFDGVALAWAIVEYIVKHSNGSTRTIFATHYHELTELEGRLPEVFTMNIAIRESNDSILFLHKLIPGPSDRSYGVEVARLAGIPQQIIQRAKELLSKLECGRQGMQEAVRKTAQNLLPGLDLPKKELPQKKTTTHPLLKAIQSIEPERMTPMEAFNLLIEWKRRWGHKEKA